MDVPAQHGVDVRAAQNVRELRRVLQTGRSPLGGHADRRMVQRDHSPGGRRSGQHLSEPAELLGPDAAGDGAGTRLSRVTTRTPLTSLVAAQASAVAGLPTSRSSVSRWPVPVAGPQDRGEGDPGVVVPDTPGLGGAAVTGEGPDEVEGVGVGLWGAVISDVAADQDQVDVGYAPCPVDEHAGARTNSSKRRAEGEALPP